MDAAYDDAIYPQSGSIIPVIVALLVPRLLILFWIYTDQGITIWFLLHVIALLIAWGGGGHRVYRRRRVWKSTISRIDPRRSAAKAAGPRAGQLAILSRWNGVT